MRKKKNDSRSVMMTLTKVSERNLSNLFKKKVRSNNVIK